MRKLLAVLIMAVLIVAPASAQDVTPEPTPVVTVSTTPYDAAIITLVAVVVALLGIGGTVLVKNSSPRMIGEIVISVLELGAKLTPTKSDDAEIAKLRAEWEHLKEQMTQSLTASLTAALEGKDVTRDEVEADG